MNARLHPVDGDEPRWIQSFMDLTGVTESQARSVFMYVACRETPPSEAVVQILPADPAADLSAAMAHERAAWIGTSSGAQTRTA